MLGSIFVGILLHFTPPDILESGLDEAHLHQGHLVLAVVVEQHESQPLPPNRLVSLAVIHIAFHVEPDLFVHAFKIDIDRLPARPRLWLLLVGELVHVEKNFDGAIHDSCDFVAHQMLGRAGFAPRGAQPLWSLTSSSAMRMLCMNSIWRISSLLTV